MVQVVCQNCTDRHPSSDIGPFNYQAVAHTAFAVGRFLTALAGLIVKPRWILLFLYVGVIITSALAMNLEGYAGVAMVVLVSLFESGIFSIIFAMCIRGLGAHTKLGAMALTASTSGGAVIPAIMSRVTESRGLPDSFAVVVAVFVFGSILPLYTAVVPAAKDQVDPVHQRHVTYATEGRRAATPNRASRVFGAMKRRNTESADIPRTEHVESDGEKALG